MILIISNSSFEPTTDSVIDWLMHKKASFVRIGPGDLILKDFHNAIDLDGSWSIGGRNIQLQQVNVVWYRRWYEYNLLMPVKPKTMREIKLYRELADEITSVLFYLANSLSDKKWLNHPIVTSNYNKLTALRLAREGGVDVPDTLVTTSKEELAEFIQRHGEAITKPIGDIFVYTNEQGDIFKSYTEIITPGFLHKYKSPNFFLSMFQQRIKAEYEIRCFYLDGKFYPTAILNNEEVDIKLSVRTKKQTTMVKCTLPAAFTHRLDHVMKKLGVNSASIDILKGLDGKYYFLEANPIGQFSGYGGPCNYQLERIVAEWLIENDVKQYN